MKKTYKTIRPAWVLRIGSGALDTGACIVLAGAIPIPPAYQPGVAIIFLVCGMAYCESRWGITLGKSVFRMHTLGMGGAPLSPNRAFMRGVFRFLLLPVAWLSWRRVSLLDLVTKTRVHISGPIIGKSKGRRGFDPSRLVR